MAHMVFTAFAIGSGTLLSALSALFLGLCVFHLDAVRRPLVLPTALYGVGAALFVISLVSWGFNNNSPKLDSVLYGADADTHKNVFASFDARTDEYTSRFFTGSAR
jgi:hypothetical protein